MVVAFSEPVKDFAADTPSVSVTGATIASVAAHIVAGEPANAYLFTLTPDGDGPITLRLFANQSCASGGICTADGARLSVVPEAYTIEAPVRVSFTQAELHRHGRRNSLGRGKPERAERALRDHHPDRRHRRHGVRG